MNKTLSTLTASVVLAILAGSDAMAHPSFMDGGIGGYAFSFGYDATTGQATVNRTRPSRPTNVDSIQINHGCVGPDHVTITEPVAAVSWVWPKGEGLKLSGKTVIDNGLAPMSTQCNSSGSQCTGAGTQPSVARIPDSTKKPNLGGVANPAGVGTATTLASELVHAYIPGCVTVGHSTTCSSSPSTVPVTSLSGLAQFQGNLGYFKTNISKANGFYARGNKFDAAQIAAMGYSSVAAPHHNPVQITWADPMPQLAPGVTKSYQSGVVPFYFSQNSCARRLVVRLAGADICAASLKPSVTEIAANDSVNFWMGGPTKKFDNVKFSLANVAHGIHENFWISYTLLVRDTATNPYPASCTDKVKGDYDLVVMPTVREIDTVLPFPGFATAL